MKFAKIICGAVQVPQNYPYQIELGGHIVSNPTEEQYRSAGYLPLEESEPEEQKGKIAVATYNVNESKTKIVQTWIYENIEPEHTPEPME